MHDPTRLPPSIDQGDRGDLGDRLAIAAGSALVLAVATRLWWALIARDHTRIAEGTTQDADQFVWSMEHTWRQIAAGRNPFLTDHVYAGAGGLNLAYNTTAPGVALVFTPVTWLLGPFRSLGLFTVLVPVLAFVATFVWLRALLPAAGRWSLAAAGVAVAWSPFLVVRNGHHVNLAAGAALLVAICWLGQRWAARPSPTRSLTLGAALGFTVWVSTEMVALGVVVAPIVVAAAVVSGAVRLGESGRRVLAWARGEWAAVVTVTGAAAVVALPFLVAYLFGRQRFGADYHADDVRPDGIEPLNLIRADRSRLLRPWAFDGGVLPAEATGYVTVVGLVAMVWVFARWRGLGPVGRTAAVAWVGLTVLSFGLPPLDGLPLIGQAIATRFSWFALLALVVAVADAVSRRLAPPRVALAAAVVAGVLWVPTAPFATAPVEHHTAAEIGDVCRGQRVLVVPRAVFGVSYATRAMAWQAAEGIAFDLVRGRGFRADGTPDYALDTLFGAPDPSDAQLAEAAAELAATGTGCLVAPAAPADGLEALLGAGSETPDGWRIWSTAER